MNVFWNFFERSGPEGTRGVKKKFQKTLILAFEAIVQLPEYTYVMEEIVRPKSRKSHIVGSIAEQSNIKYIFKNMASL